MHDDTPKHPESGSRLQFSDPRIQAIADRAARAAELAVERVAANAMDPDTYPLPRDPRSLERLLKSVIDSLPAVKRQEIFARAQPGVRASAAARRSRFGDLAAVDLRASPSVTEQVRAIALPPNLRIPDRELPALAEKLKRQFFPPIITQPTAAATATKMDPFVTSATCSEPTAHESGADEIVATGILINEQGVVSNTNAADLGQFNAGTSRAFSNLSLRSFDLSTGAFPKLVAFAPIVLEKDHAKLADVLSAIAIALSTIGFAVAIGGLATGNPIVLLIGALAEVLGGLLTVISLLLLDEILVTDELFGVAIQALGPAPGLLATTDVSLRGRQNVFGQRHGAYTLSFNYTLS